MSFYVVFHARTLESARQKLAKAHAPQIVKALIEKAIEGAFPTAGGVSSVGTQNNFRNDAVSGSTVSGSIGVPPAKQAQPAYFGVSVEVEGYVADIEHAPSGSSIKFKVTPLFD